jgi:DNA polymerase-3 subunit delta'
MDTARVASTGPALRRPTREPCRLSCYDFGNRTMSLSSVAGHRSLLYLVSRAVARDTLPQSLLFTGPDGVGKRLVAVAVAQTFNCLSPAPSGTLTIDACGLCSACGRVARGTHTDVVTVEPGESGVIMVEQVRQVIDQVAYRPFEGRRRVVIVDDADRLSPQAQNAFLKTLEEPPDSSQFVLVTARPDTLLDTVRSRCPQLRFGQIAESDIVATLITARGYTENEARPAAAMAGGSFSKALQFATGELTAARDAAVGLLQTVSASPNPRARLEGAKMLISGKRSRRSTVAADRDELGRRLRALTSLFRDLELLSARANAGRLANADLQAGLEKLAPSFGKGRSRQGFEFVDRALDAVSRNVSPKVIADWLACQL